MYNENKKATINVSISDVKFSKDLSFLKTTLGSCVSVVLYPKKISTENYICSMSHYLLPRPAGNFNLQKEKNPFKYGSILVNHQIQKMYKAGYQAKDLHAKISGGSAMFKSKNKGLIPDIGLENVEVAKSTLAQEKIPVIATDIGGILGRSIEFDPETTMLKVTIFGQDYFFI